MIAADNGQRRVDSMNLPDLTHKVLAFPANVGLAFRIVEIWGMGRVDASYIVRKELILDLEPFFLLSKLVEPRCDFLCCHALLFNRFSNFLNLDAQNWSK